MRRLGNGHWSRMTLRRWRRVKRRQREIETMDTGTLDRCVGLSVSMCLAHVLNSCIGQLRNKTNHRAPWHFLFGLMFKVVLFCLVFGSRFWQSGSASICDASFAFSLLAFGGFYAPVLIKIWGSEDRTHDLGIMGPTGCQLRYHRPVHLPDSPMLDSKGLIIMEHGKPNLA